MVKRIKKSVMKFSLLDLLGLLMSGLRWLASQVRLGRLILALVSGVGTLGIVLLLTKTPFLAIARDLAIAEYAHVKAGNDIPFEADYIQSALYNPEDLWGVMTNSVWLVDRTNKIVPYFAYEDVTSVGRYPVLIAWLPYQDESSFHIAGQAASLYAMVVLNERMLPGHIWNDEREALTTAVHELIHIQLGNFAFAPPGTDHSVWVESHTQSATVEVLAAMCRYGETAACEAFWQNIESYSKASFRTYLNDTKLGWLFDPIANLFWRDAQQERSAEKANRFWAQYPGEREGILYRYGALPWREYVLPGLKGAKLNTGIKETLPGSLFTVVLGMPFDDTRAEFGLLQYLAWVGK